MKKFKPHLFVLGLLSESRFGMGRVLLAECLIGEKTERIKKLKLDKLFHFASLPLYSKKDVYSLIDLMKNKKLIEFQPLPNNKFIKVLHITEKGSREFADPSIDLEKSQSFEGSYSKIEHVTEEDKLIFESLGDALDGLSDEQKKASISTSSHILCIAGAGSGKTRVLTKRAWCLSKLRSVAEEKILAITFTRKAKQEMQKRLAHMLPNNMITIETFNSFCEKILKKNQKKIYDKPCKVMGYREKVKLFMQIIKDLNMSLDYLLDRYYSKRKRLEEKKILFLRFMNDIFSLLDYQQNNSLTDPELNRLISGYELGKTIRDIISAIKHHKEKHGYRDYTDQLTHTITFFKKDRKNIPEYTHILIDEYQDINSLQFELIDLLAPKNLFAVGDPRQSIYGWRGSRIDYILDFEQIYKDAQILQLSTNYRSSKKIVNLCNDCIKPMKLPDLKTDDETVDGVNIIKHDTIDTECTFICQSILSLDCPKNEIFVLARTNKQIETLSSHMDKHKIKYLKRTIEEKKTNLIPSTDQVTISTIHAIKGLEAETVFILGANTKNHPCKANEHPLLEAVKINDTYDKYAEELRLFYVALSRAKSKLIINYTGSLCSYITPETQKKIKKVNLEKRKNLYDELRCWRKDTAQKYDIPAYHIFSDKTLTELCEIRPSSAEELNMISGFGPYKTKRFAEHIIRIIQQHP